MWNGTSKSFFSTLFKISSTIWGTTKGGIKRDPETPSIGRLVSKVLLLSPLAESRHKPAERWKGEMKNFLHKNSINSTFQKLPKKTWLLKISSEIWNFCTLYSECKNWRQAKLILWEIPHQLWTSWPKSQLDMNLGRDRLSTIGNPKCFSAVRPPKQFEWLWELPVLEHNAPSPLNNELYQFLPPARPGDNTWSSQARLNSINISFVSEGHDLFPELEFRLLSISSRYEDVPTLRGW